MTDTLFGASFIFGPMIAFLVWHFTHPEKKEVPPQNHSLLDPTPKQEFNINGLPISGGVDAGGNPFGVM
jgi:hypothetical protein